MKLFKDYSNYLIPIIILLALLLRFYQLNFEDYWLDEQLPFWVSDPNISLSETLSRREFIDQRPPLFHLILKITFLTFGYNSEIGRYVPFIFGCLSLFALLMLANELNFKKEKLFFIFLLSSNIYLIKYSQETTPYSLVFFLSSLNILFYYKIIRNKLSNKGNKKNIFLFYLFSVLSLSAHPFVMIILFSQFINSTYSFFRFKIFHKKYFLLILPILLTFVFVNFSYLTDQLSYKEYFLDHTKISFFYNFFFSRFFGSNIMGALYLFVFLSLIITSLKLLFIKENRIIFLLFLIFFSYFIPLMYEYVRFPILTDRYIMFVLIPIFTIISYFAFVNENIKFKKIIIITVVIATLVNLFIEIVYRENTKPEYNKILNKILTNNNLNVSLYSDQKTYPVLKNYIINLEIFKNNNFYFNEINHYVNNKKDFWLICYEPVVGFNCKININEDIDYNVVETFTFHLINAKKITF